jgi:cullin 1
MELFNPIHEPLLNALLRMIEKGRNGEVVETSLLKEVIGSFGTSPCECHLLLVSMGQGDSNSLDKVNLDVYRGKFQDPFLETTGLYYRQESANFLASQSVVDYMIRAENRLAEESARVDLFLHPSTQKPLLQKCEDELIKAHKEALEGEFQGLIDGDRQTDLARLYSLLSKISPGLDVVKVKFEQHVRKAGLASVEKIAASDGSAPDGKVYVDALLDVHKTYHALVVNAFRGDAEFVKCLDNVCTRLPIAYRRHARTLSIEIRCVRQEVRRVRSFWPGTRIVY